MISINEHIEYLINKHDCVVVPGWGALIAQYQSAKIDEVSGIMQPPMRTISFNRDINHNDGLIATSLMRRDKITYDAAVKIINTEVDVMNHQLNIDGEISIGHIGVFRKTKNDNILFEPFVVKNSYSWLPAVSIEEKCVEGDKDNNAKNDVVYIPVSRNFFKLAASIVLLIALGLTLSTPLTIDDSQINYASISTPKVSVPDAVNPQFIEPAADAELIIAVPDSKEAMAEVDTIKTISVDGVMQALRCDDGDAYCLVIASLATRELAEEYVSERGDGDMRILESNGKYRIYIATGTTASQARMPMQSASFAEKYPAAWVCRK